MTKKSFNIINVIYFTADQQHRIELGTKNNNEDAHQDQHMYTIADKDKESYDVIYKSSNSCYGK